MMEFNEYNLTARSIAVHYSKKLNNQFAENVLLGNKEITSQDEATLLTNFFWEMSDLAAEDYENDIQVEGGVDLEHWMEKLMNIFIGYIRKSGFNQQWIDESNRINNA